VIPRYTRPEIGAVWTSEAKLQSWLEVELAATEAWAAEGVVPPEAAEQARAQAAFTVEAVEEREKVTDHDVAAFVDVVAESVGEGGRWIHYGLTSSDVLDTALALQLRRAGEIVLASACAYRDALLKRALEHRDTLCVGRTHGVHAEPTTFGLRLAGFAFEADRNLDRLEEAFAQLAVGKLSGAVGTYASVPPAVEARVMQKLGLGREDVATQVVPRDRHAELLAASASRPRSATCRKPRCARSRSRSPPARRAPRRCRTSATRSAPSGSPASPASSAATRRPGSRTSPSGTSATSPTPAPSASSSPTPPSCSITCRTWRRTSQRG
jgi:adenylosuccinate lyase